MSSVSGSHEIDAWISQFPASTRKLLNQIRKTVTQAVPQAEEVIRYGIPTLRLKQNLLHYAAFENHIGFYPTPSALRHFAEQLRGYQQGKGSVQFPLNQPLPLELIAEIAEFRAGEVAATGTKKLSTPAARVKAVKKKATKKKPQ